jgi:hypothetical protein
MVSRIPGRGIPAQSCQQSAAAHLSCGYFRKGSTPLSLTHRVAPCAVPPAAGFRLANSGSEPQGRWFLAAFWSPFGHFCTQKPVRFEFAFGTFVESKGLIESVRSILTSSSHFHWFFRPLGRARISFLNDSPRWQKGMGVASVPINRPQPFLSYLTTFTHRVGPNDHGA